MRLRSKTLLMSALAILLLVMPLSLCVRSVVLAEVDRLERASVHEAAVRARNAVTAELTALGGFTNEQSCWDELYEFADNPAPQFAADNLANAAHERQALSSIVIQRTSGEVVFQSGYDLAHHRPTAPPRAIVHLVTHLPPLASQGLVGLLGVPDGGLWLVAGMRLRHSDESGPVRARIFMIRALDGAAVARISATTHQRLRVWPLPAEETLRQRPGPGSDVVTRPLSRSEYAGYALLRDARRRPIGVIRTTSRRQMSGAGNIAFWALLLTGGLGVAGNLLLQQRTVVSPLRRVEQHVRTIGRTGDLSRRIPTSSNDEVATVSRAINGMLEDLAAAQEDLREQQLRYRGLIEALPDAVLVHSAGVLVLANASARRLLGAPTDAYILGRPVAEFVATGATPAEPTSLREARLRGLDGRTTEVELREVPFPGMGPDAKQLVAHDVSAERSLREQLRQTQKMEALGRLAGGVAHDFNNVITVIAAHAQMLQLRAADDATREGLEEVSKAVQRAASLTRQLLAFSRKQVLQPRVLDLGEIIRDIEKMLQRLLGEDVKLETSTVAASWPIHADPGQLEQVLLNLAVNARDAMPRGGTLRIEASNFAARDDGGPVTCGDWVRLAVRDTGVGMTEATKARIFEPFFTTKAQGTGLGLATVFGIVEQSQGHILVESRLGVGTVFEVYFPRAVAAASATGDAKVAGTRGRETILVVEDDVPVRCAVREILRVAGYRTLEAGDGREAMSLWNEHGASIDLVLSDVVMPEIGGPELMRWLSAQRHSIKTIFMSGYTDEARFDEILAKTGADFLHKPFTPDELTQRVRQALDRMPPWSGRPLEIR